jgi:DNA-directed RNA polymerase subunit RPC12/RpoP
MLLSVLAEGRKVSLCFLAASHNDTAEALGLWGDTDMVTCFDYIVYLGGLATKKERIPLEFRKAASEMERPAVVLHSEYNEWFLLDVPIVHPTSSGRDLDDDDPMWSSESTAVPNSAQDSRNSSPPESHPDNAQESSGFGSETAQPELSSYACAECGEPLENLQQQSSTKRYGYCLACKDLSGEERLQKKMLSSWS